MGIRFVGVEKRFGEVAAVAGIDLEIGEGEFFSLLGPSGCGKTTLLRMLAGLETPSAGRVLIGNEDVTEVPPYRRPVNMMFQSYALFPHMSVADNVAFGLKQEGKAKAEIKDRVAAMLDLVQLGELGGRKPNQLSGGQRQRVALARCLVKSPRVVLLDEPLAALDKKLRQQTQFELVRIQRQVGITFVMVTHDQEEAMTMSDRLAVMRSGKIEGIGSPRDVYDSPSTEFVATFLGASNLLAGTLEAASGALSSVTLTDGTSLSVPHERVPALAGSTTLKVGVRPEKISIGVAGTSVPAGHNALRGRVRVSTFTGVGNQYLVDSVSGTELTVYAQNIGQELAPRSGDEVVLTWPIEHTFAVVPMTGSNDEESTNDEE